MAATPTMSTRPTLPMMARWCGGGVRVVSGTPAGSVGGTSESVWPQRQVETLLGTRRPHAGQTLLEAGESWSVIYEKILT